MYSKKLHLYSLFTASATLVLIAAGGLVTSTGSGLSVPDWPLSYGQLMPPMIGGIRFEHSHRMIAAFVGLCTAVLSVWIWRGDKRPFMRALAVTASFAVLLQAVLGGVTVRYLLPTPVSVGHACLGQSFFCLLCLIALFLSPEWREARPAAPQPGLFFRLCCTTAGFAFAQLVIGAVVRHTGGKALALHLFFAFFIVVHTVFLNFHLFRNRAFTRSLLGQTVLLDALLICQLFLGLGSFVLKYALERGIQPHTAEVLFTTAHQTTGALILANLFVLCFRTRRLFGAGTPGASSDFLALMKWRVTLAALATTLAGYLLASAGPVDWTRLFHTLLGAFLAGGGGNALNQYLERNIDLKMPRTENRPLPSGRLSPAIALVFGSVVSAAGILELLIFVSPKTAAVAAAVFFGYVFLYTPLKRMTPLNTYVGAVSGALPAALGWVAADGHFSAGAVTLFLILFIWQLPHFYAIAWTYRNDYEKGGLRMMSVPDKEGGETAFQIALFSVVLFAAALLPYWIGLSGKVYLAAAVLAGAAFVGLALELVLKKLSHTKRFTTASIAYLFVIILFMVADKS